MYGTVGVSKFTVGNRLGHVLAIGSDGAGAFCICSSILRLLLKGVLWVTLEVIAGILFDDDLLCVKDDVFCGDVCDVLFDVDVDAMLSVDVDGDSVDDAVLVVLVVFFFFHCCSSFFPCCVDLCFVGLCNFSLRLAIFLSTAKIKIYIL